MPSTTYNIDRILNKVANASREDIRQVLDEIQLIVYSQDCFQTMKLISSGMPPYLVTQNNVYEYDCPSDCRRTEAILSLSAPRGYSRTRPVGPRKEYYFRNKMYQALAIEQRDATYDQVGKVYFQQNPGATTTTYYHAYYLKPTRITDETIQLIIPEEKHYLLRSAVIAMFTTEEYGQSPYDEQAIERVARKVRDSLNQYATGSMGTTPIPEELQDYPESGYYGWW